MPRYFVGRIEKPKMICIKCGIGFPVENRFLLMRPAGNSVEYLLESVPSGCANCGNEATHRPYFFATKESALSHSVGGGSLWSKISADAVGEKL
tara:strand:+ start:740 stop:1021 length:282 start_codon:yes stop_codon:yes gene_type:complete